MWVPLVCCTRSGVWPEAGLHVQVLDGSAVVGELHEAALVSPDEEDAGASLMVGLSGILLIATVSRRRRR